jgi:hypothetical protein
VINKGTTKMTTLINDKEVLISDNGHKIDITTISYEELQKQYPTKSALIRALHSDGYKNGPISKYMDIRYQHVHNVLSQPLKKKD